LNIRQNFCCKIFLVTLILLFTNAYVIAVDSSFDRINNLSRGNETEEFEAVGIVKLDIGSGSGVLIADSLVLTAAHIICDDVSPTIPIEDQCPKSATFTLQNVAPIDDPNNLQDVSFTGTVIYYPGYSDISNGCSDFALIKLNTPVSKKVKNVVPLSIEDPKNPNQGNILTVIGYGDLGCCDIRTSGTEKHVKELPAGNPNGDGEISSISIEPVCGGDSGGPAFRNGKIVGIVSEGPNPGNVSCPGLSLICSTQREGVYDWIINEINKSSI